MVTAYVILAAVGGLLVGTVFGFFVAGLCVTLRKSNEDATIMFDLKRKKE